MTPEERAVLEAAEAKVARVEALANEWRAFGRTDVAWHWVSLAERLDVELTDIRGALQDDQ